MKPILLTIQALGPYASRVEIDMRKMTDAGLYLICGDTGAGKTMIFDAITYALYGAASGESRDPATMRSKFASSDEPSFASLTFENRGEEYTVYRELSRERMKKGVLVEEKSSEAWLRFPDGRTVTKHRDVTAAVCDVIGLDRERFCRTVMIAQGEFRALLEADTGERMTVLRNIFGTSHLARFSARAREEHLEERRRAEAIRENAVRYAALISTSDTKLAEAMAKVPYIAREELAAAVEKYTEEARSSLAESDARIKKLSAELGTARTCLARAEADRHAEERFADAEKSLFAAREKLSAAEESCASLPVVREEISEGRKRAAVLTALLPEYAELAELKKAIADIAYESAKCASRLDAADKRLGELEAERTALCETADKLRASLEARSSVQSRLDALERERADAEHTMSKIHDLRGCEARRKAAESEYHAALTRLSELRASYNRATALYLDGIAGILAASLSDGVPCPVCGSTSHPSPAETSDGEMTRDAIEKLRAECDAQAVLAEERASRLGGIRSEESILLGELGEQAGGDGLISERLKELDTETASLRRELDTSLREAELLAETEARIGKTADELERERGNISADRARYAELGGVLGEKRDRLTSLEQKLTFEDIDTLRKEIRECGNMCSKLEREADEAERARETAALEHEACRAAAEAARAGLDGSLAPREEEYRALTEHLEREYAEETSRRAGLAAELEHNRISAGRVTEELSRLAECEERERILGLISDTANGTVRGKEKIMLETFWQMRLFERIIRRANVRLMKMSDGRYELERRKSADNQKEKSGLELDVIDHWSGKSRGVKTLSGGESFAASLALALALSDETEAEAGGVHIDCVFIDEGFGSLDGDALEVAMSVLRSQSQNGRSVGIISHVAELRERIEHKLNVTKTSGGSRVEWI